MPALSAWDGTAWRSIAGLWVWDGAVWQAVRQLWVWDGTAWRVVLGAPLDAPTISIEWQHTPDPVLDVPSIVVAWSDNNDELAAPTITAVWQHDFKPTLDVPTIAVAWVDNNDVLDPPSIAVAWQHDFHPMLDTPSITVVWQEDATQLSAPTISAAWVPDAVPAQLDAPSIGVAWQEDVPTTLDRPSIAVAWQHTTPALDAPAITAVWEEDRPVTGNLIVNGSAESGTNANFSGFVFATDPAVPVGTPNCFERTSTSATMTSDAYVPVDITQPYEVTAWARNVAGNGVHTYIGVAPYDASKRFIAPEDVLIRDATIRTVTQAVAATDRVVHLDNVTGINPSDPSSEWLAFNAQTDLSDLPNFTVRHITAVDTVAKTVTLATAAGTAYPVGTPTRIHNAGGTYIYAAAANASLTQSWQRYQGTVSGTIDPITQVGTGNKFRQGTKYVRFLALVNRDGTTPTSTTRIGGVRLIKADGTLMLDTPSISPAWQHDEGPALDAPHIAVAWAPDRVALDRPVVTAVWQHPEGQLDRPTISVAWQTPAETPLDKPTISVAWQHDAGT